jgi:hypothetical protein
MSQPHFEASVRMKLTLPKVGTWSPPGLLKIQSLIAGVQTPCIEVFFIPLERSWSVDVQNGLAWAIWTYASPCYGQKKGHESNWQFDSRPLKVGNRPKYGVCSGVCLKESYKFALDLILIGGMSKKLWTLKVSGVQTKTIFLGLHIGSPGKSAIQMQVRWSNTKNTIWGKMVAFPESRPWWVKWVRVAHGLSQHQKWFRMWTNQLTCWLVLMQDLVTK